MTSKYHDLTSRIIGDTFAVHGADVAVALHWLDEHPDQLPVRTITESELEDATREVWGYCARESDIRFLAYFGILVVPDPEPSNAERLKEMLKRKSTMTNYSATVVAKRLDAAGVIAPGGDE